MGLSMQIATLVNLKSGLASGVCFFLEQDNVGGGGGGAGRLIFSINSSAFYIYIYT